MAKPKPEGLQLSLPCTRIGRMGMLDLGHDYMAGVKSRADMLAKATRVVRPVKQNTEDR